MKIGYFIPEFPGQTHTFFWREIVALEALGLSVTPISTRCPPPSLVVHNWSAAAAARTLYLAPLSAGDAARAVAAMPRWPLSALWRGPEPISVRFALEWALFISFGVKLAWLCREHGIEHLHVGSCGRAAFIAALARLIDGAPYSLTLHNPLTTFGRHQQFKWAGAEFGTVITRTLLEPTRRALGSAAPDHLRVQAMGVDVERFRRRSPYAPWTPGEPLHLFSCARLNPAKGHLVTLRATRLLRDRGIDARLTIAGEDDHGGDGYRRTVEAEIAALGLDEAATLLGAVEEDVVAARLNEAHVFVLASDSEPLGVAYMEAMACETPVVGTDSGGVPELITPNVDGLLVPPHDPSAVANAVERLARDPALARRLGETGRATVCDRFQSSFGARTLAELIESEKVLRPNS